MNISCSPGCTRLAAAAAAIVTAAAVLACAPAHRIAARPLDRGASDASTGGVRVVADTNEWSGDRLAPGLMPLLVRLENGSDRPLRIRYAEVRLAVRGGSRLEPLAPFDLSQKDPRMPSRYAYPWYAFQLAPHLGLFYRGFWTDHQPFAHDAEQFARGYRELTTHMQPTTTMMRRALPEGVLPAGGYISGMLYFATRELAGATLVVQLVDGRTAERFATVELPLVVTG
jgi:hypothetical protein